VRARAGAAWGRIEVDDAIHQQEIDYGKRASKQGRTSSLERHFFAGSPMQRTLIVIGLVVAAVGLAWPWLRRLPFGRLPGDIHIVREGFSFHFPIVTCIVISIVVSVILWMFRR
jgi:hypothetical protein